MGLNNDDEDTVPYGDGEDEAYLDAPVDEPTLLGADDLENDESTTLPRFLQDEGAFRHFRWIPSSVRRFGRKVGR